jgi:putative DNA primase/helicase
MLNTSSSSNTPPPDFLAAEVILLHEPPRPKPPHAWDDISTHRLGITFFPDIYASTLTANDMTLRALHGLILRTQAPTKGALPWLKGARFGDKRSPKADGTESGCLRWDGNVLSFDLIELDYDKGVMGFDEAVTTIKAMNVRALIYTTPSHTIANPRWRLLLPVSCAHELETRAKLCARVNGRFGGVFATESFTLSQSYYYGLALDNPAPDHRCEVIDGRMIDLCDDLYKFQKDGFPKPIAAKTPPGNGKTKTANGGMTFEAHLESMGDGGELRGFNNPLVAAIASYAWRHGADLDREVLKSKLRAAIHAAPRSITRKAEDIDRYLGDKYLDEAITSAIGKFGTARQSAGGADVVTEDSAALEFVERHGDVLRYCHTTGGWFKWSAVYWAEDKTTIVFQWARELVRQLAANQDERKRYITNKTSFASGVERFAKSDQRIAVTFEYWDTNLWLLGTPGGTVDLRTGELRDSRPGEGITKITSVAPLDTGCPLWLKFLDETTGKDDELIRFLQQWCGYGLTGSVREHALTFVYGPGGNGKGVFMNVITKIMGDYAATAAMDTFTASISDKHPTDVAKLRGARIVTASETEEGKAWAESRIKQLTGGDRISARFMRQDFFEYDPQFKLMLIGNHKPVLRNVDDAARRRFLLVPFEQKPPKPDFELEAKLLAEGPAILRWMILGCLDWQRDGLVKPPSVIAATDEYFADQDQFAQWLGECCECDPGNNYKTATSAELFQSWKAYATAAGEDSGSQKSFSGRIARHGFVPKRTLKARTYLGIRLIRPASYHDGE